MTFQPKNVFLRLISDNVWLVALKMVTIVVIMARHVPWVNLLCFGVRNSFETIYHAVIRNKMSTRANQKFEMATIFQHGRHAIISAME